MNYCFQKKEKYLRIFTTKEWIKQMNHLRKIDYSDFKFVINSSNLETELSELKDPLAFLDSIKKRDTSTEEAQYRQEEFNRYLKKNKNQK